MTAMDRIFDKERPDMICHLAARAGVRPSIKDPELYVKANINGTLVMLEMTKKYNVKNMVYASSSSVYGKNAKVPFAESDRTDDPVSPYAATKKACELLATTYSNLYGINVSGLRFFTVYGPRGRPDMGWYWN
jgi:UDP-glucuronate 4-epimerase